MNSPSALLLALLLLAGNWTEPAKADSPDVFNQSRRLARGVNVLGYDPIWRSREQARFQEKDFRLIKEAGFSTLRVNLHPFAFMAPASQGAVSNSWWQVVDWTLANARTQQLNVILDLHEFDALGRDPQANKEKFLAFWRQCASRYQEAPESVYFEILNEPSRQLAPELWNGWLREALAIIRASNPTRPVLVGPASYNSIAALDKLDLPAEDSHLIATVHYYLPFAFTHQGTSWTDRKDKIGIPWAGDEQDQAAIQQDFDHAAAWAKAHHRPIYLGEFGAYEKGDLPSRVRYTASVARAAERRGWSWAYWQFEGNFVVYDTARDGWVEPILKALIPSR